MRAREVKFTVLVLGLCILIMETSIRQIVAADLKDQIESKTLPSLKLKLIKAKDKTFTMGSPKEEEGRDSDETQRKVTFKADFYMGVHTVTQAQFETVMGRNPSKFNKDNGGSGDHPVEQVNWYDAIEFCNKLSAMDGKSACYKLSKIERDKDESIAKAEVTILDNGAGYRLPHEEQWEYACRAGSTARFFFGDAEAKLGDYAWYEKNSDSKTHAVGEKKPNAWGLYDMHGNVWQWCENLDTNEGSFRVNRGGGWINTSLGCRSASRNWGDPDIRDDYLGFRVSVPVR